MAMRRTAWLTLFVAITLCAAWIVAFSGWTMKDNPIASRLAAAFLAFVAVGSYWMLFDAWKHEKRLTRKLWLFFVPGGFLWYYFAVCRLRELRKGGFKTP